MPSTKTRTALVAFILTLGCPGAPLAASDLLSQLGDAVDTGRLESSSWLRPGSFAVSAGESVVVQGAPVANLEVVVRRGRLELFRYSVTDESLLLVGRGPDVVLTRLEADATGVVTSAEFHGRGVGGLMVGLSRPAVMKRVLQLRVHTDLARLFRGDVFAAAGEPPPAADGAPPEPAGTDAPSAGRPTFLDLVNEVRIVEFRFTARPGRRLSLGGAFQAETGGGGEKDPVEVRFEEAAVQPGHDGAATRWSAKAKIDGSLGAGSIGLGTGAVAFRSAELLGGRFSVENTEGSAQKELFRAGSLRMELPRSSLKLPGGISVAVDQGSRLGISGLVLEADGAYLGRLDFSLLAASGEIRHDGRRLTIPAGRVSSSGLLVRDGRATGPLSLDVDLRLVQPLSLRHPEGHFPTKSVPLEIRGPLSVRLTLADVGVRTGGTIEGEYSLRVPWKPVEAATAEAMTVRWNQDAKGERALALSLEPRAFGPCGPRCFVASFTLAAEPRSGGAGPGRMRCSFDGRAELVVDPAGRSLVLKGFTVSPRCKGAPAWLSGLGSGLLTGTFSGATLLRLPPELPFPVETVRSGSDFVRIDGTVTWNGGEPAGASPAPAAAAAPAPAPTPSPAATAPTAAAAPPTATGAPAGPRPAAPPVPAPVATPVPVAPPAPPRSATPSPAPATTPGTAVSQPAAIAATPAATPSLAAAGSAAPPPAAPAAPAPPASGTPTVGAASPTVPPVQPDMVDPGGEVAVPAPNPSYTKVGAGKCGLCHKAQFASWANSGHARRKPPLDCEACHGPGSEYRMLTVMKNPARSKAAGLVLPDGAFCGRCHKGTADAAFLAKAHVHRKTP